MKLKKFEIRRPTMTRSAWWRSWFDVMALSILTVVLVFVAPVPTPTPFLVIELAVIMTLHLSVAYLTVLVRVLPPEPRDNGSSRPGTLRMAWRWLKHMSNRLASVKARLSAQGALGKGGRA